MGPSRLGALVHMSTATTLVPTSSLILRVLVVHNSYQQAGGEDSVFEAEVRLLRNAGHHVSVLKVSNDGIKGPWASAKAATGSVYSLHGRRLVSDAIQDHQPDVVHVHNFFPRLSPSVFDACADAGVPAVWTLHNFRVFCSNGLMFRDGGPCTLCLGGSSWPGVVHRCYRNSLVGSATVAAMIAFHRKTNTWSQKVTRFIALTDFARDLFIQSGVPPEKIVVKANFIPDPGRAHTANSVRSGAVYVGRLSEEKGVECLVRAWRTVPVPLTIYGDGPMRQRLEQIAPANVRFVGWQSREIVDSAIAAAGALIVPSLWYENFPMTVVEATAAGTPIIASRHGALETIVEDGVSGRLFHTGDAADLSLIARECFADPVRLRALGSGARATYELRSAPDINLKRLISIYSDAISCKDSFT